MELAIATDFADECVCLEDYRRDLKQIARAGFTHIHWCYEWGSEYLYAVSEMRQIREWMDELGLRAKSLHASHGGIHKNYLSESEPNRVAGVELVKNRVELAHILGAKEIVLHMYLPYRDFQRDPSAKAAFYGRACRSLDELEPTCRGKGVRICLENLFEAPGEMQLEQFGTLFEKYPADFLGLCLDSGHAFLVWGKEFVEKLAVPFRDRIYSVHLHDNRGWGSLPGCGDAHRVPADPNFPWKELMGVLRDSAYENPLTLEVSLQGREKTEDFLRYAYGQGQWLYSLQGLDNL